MKKNNEEIILMSPIAQQLLWRKNEDGSCFIPTKFVIYQHYTKKTYDIGYTDDRGCGYTLFTKEYLRIKYVRNLLSQINTTGVCDDAKYFKQWVGKDKDYNIPGSAKHLIMKYSIIIINKNGGKKQVFDAANFLSPLSPVGEGMPFKPITERQSFKLFRHLMDGDLVQDVNHVIELKPPKINAALEIKGGTLYNIVTDSDNIHFSCIDWDSLIEEGETNEFTDYDEWTALSPEDFQAHVENPKED